MTEEEKMLAGEIYDANNDKGLIEKRIIAKELCKKYNELHVRDIIGKKGVIEKLLQKVTIGSNVVIGAGSVVTKDIPQNSLAVGNPCHVIRKINGEEL